MKNSRSSAAAPETVDMNELLPPRQARGRRLVGAGLALFVLGYVCYDARNFPGRMLAEKVVATGDIFVMATSDERAEEAFKRARAAQRVEAEMILVKSDRQSRTYDVKLKAPNRNAALAQLGELLQSFQREFGGEFGKDVTTFSSSWVPPVPTPKVLAWDRGMRVASSSMLATGLVLIAGGVWLLWVAVKGEKRKLAALLTDQDDSGPDPA